VPALSSSPVRSTRAASAAPITGSPGQVTPVPTGLPALLGQVIDPRRRRGVRHRLAVVPAIALAATLTGARSFAAIAGHYILTVKDNQPTLRKRVKALPWKDIPVLAVSREHGHGRQDTRTRKATELASGIGFPGAAQVVRLTRARTVRSTGKRTRETVYAVTGLTVADAGAEQITAWLRGHRMIENRLRRGPRCRLRRGPQPDPYGLRPGGYGHPAQHRYRFTSAGRPQQHRRRPAISRP